MSDASNPASGASKSDMPDGKSPLAWELFMVDTTFPPCAGKAADRPSRGPVSYTVCGKGASTAAIMRSRVPPYLTGSDPLTRLAGLRKPATDRATQFGMGKGAPLTVLPMLFTKGATMALIKD